MIRIIIIILLIVPRFAFGQVGIDWGFSVPLETALKVNTHYRFKDNQITGTYIRSVLPVKSDDILALTYSKTLGSIMPFAGWSNKGFAYGISKHIDNAVLSVAVYGDVATVSFVAGNLPKITNDLISKKQVAIIGLQLVAGFARGAREANIAGHWGKGNSFTDYENSWKNKYKDWDGGDTREAFLGSKTVFVGFTDLYHLTGNIEALAHLGTLTVAIGGKSDWKSILKTLGISIVANRVGYYSAYYKIFK